MSTIGARLVDRYSPKQVDALGFFLTNMLKGKTDEEIREYIGEARNLLNDVLTTEIVGNGIDADGN